MRTGLHINHHPFMNSVMKPLWFSILFVLVLFVQACATVDFDYPKIETTAPANTAHTHLGRQLEGVAKKYPGEAGFYPLVDGIEALAARLLLAERAEISIDAQYYLLINDVVGLAFIDALLRAADRGVRVRLLLDDMFTQGYDNGLAALDSHPNFELRIFNPFGNRSARFMDGVTGFSRINRRMHNKSFTVDNQVAVIGGRNIAAEYFGADPDKKFADLDVVGIGPFVPEVSGMFDAYWNSRYAAPPGAFTELPDDPAAALGLIREQIAQSREKIRMSRYAKAVENEVLEFMEFRNTHFTWAPYTLAYDSPDKADKNLAEDSASIITPLADALAAAEEEVVLVSPYFVPLRSGVQELLKLVDKGVDLTVVTNSLAANNHAAVHSGYAPSRKPLLEKGVHIYEARPDLDVQGTGFVQQQAGGSTLHTKAFVVDKKTLFIGSFNFDPRSAFINTESGVIIHSPELAAPFIDKLHIEAPNEAYVVTLNEKGKLRWHTMEDGKEVIYDKEPNTSWWTRLKVGLMRILPIRGQL